MNSSFYTPQPDLSVPSRVTSFEVISLGNRQVILQWEPVPIRQQYGLILCYEIGVGEQKGTYKDTL